MTDFEVWDAATIDERRRMALALSARDLVFTGLDEAGRAEFQSDGTEFVLVPGRLVRLGWDRGPLDLTPEQRSSWRSGLSELWGFEGSPEELLYDNYTADRTVKIPSLLVQRAGEHVLVDELLYDDDGDELEDGPFEVLQASLGDSFRLPTADEWEYLYRAGANTLFPWGNSWPSGSSHRPAQEDAVARNPNAFGLWFDYDTYWTELIEQELRGGDGGGDMCGGVPSPVDWRSLGCAYRPPTELWTDLLEISLEQSLFRRIRQVELRPQ